jgi:hypothetical protein
MTAVVLSPIAGGERVARFRVADEPAEWSQTVPYGAAWMPTIVTENQCAHTPFLSLLVPT